MLKTRLTLKPGRPGTKKLLAQYGSQLVCVRYRYDEELQTRCKTVELIIEEIPWPHPLERPPNDDDIVDVRVQYAEHPLREAIKRRGGEWHPATRTWKLRYADALSLRLLHRIVHLPVDRNRRK